MHGGFGCIHISDGVQSERCASVPLLEGAHTRDVQQERSEISCFTRVKDITSNATGQYTKRWANGRRQVNKMLLEITWKYIS